MYLSDPCRVSESILHSICVDSGHGCADPDGRAVEGRYEALVKGVASEVGDESTDSFVIWPCRSDSVFPGRTCECEQWGPCRSDSVFPQRLHTASSQAARTGAGAGKDAGAGAGATA